MEIEYKYKWPEDDFSRLKAKLAETGFARTGEKHQIDTYYLKEGQDEADTNFTIGEDHAYLRLRHDTLKDAFSLDLKLVNNNDRHGIFGEHEAALRDHKSLENAEAILKLLGYKKGIAIDKRRETWKKGEIEVALDDVAGLGLFTEVEIIADAAEAPDALKRVGAMARELGLSEKNMMPTGYVDLTSWKKQGKKF